MSDGTEEQILKAGPGMSFKPLPDVPQDALFLAETWKTVVENGYLTREFIEEHTGVVSAATMAAVMIKTLAEASHERNEKVYTSFALWWEANKAQLQKDPPEQIAFNGYLKALRVAGQKRSQQEKMKSFINELFEDYEGGSDLDGGDLQDLAEKHGILVPTIHHEPCSDGELNECVCAGICDDDDFKAGVKCFRLADWLNQP